MNIRRVQLQLPICTQSCESQHPFLYQSVLTYFIRDPIVVVITLIAVIGSFCLLSGLILLCMVSKTLHNQTSEAILLMGMGFFISSVACVTWKLTSKRRFAQIMEAIKEEAA